MNTLLDIASQRFITCCICEPRYRVAWLVGAPQRSRKTLLAHQLCELNGWQYLDYTSTPGYFDVLEDCIESYQPSQLVDAVRDWCHSCRAPVLVLDEIDALLATWDLNQRQVWAGQVSRIPFLPCGLIIVSHFYTLNQLEAYLPDRSRLYCLDLSGDVS